MLYNKVYMQAHAKVYRHLLSVLTLTQPHIRAQPHKHVDHKVSNWEGEISPTSVIK